MCRPELVANSRFESPNHPGWRRRTLVRSAALATSGLIGIMAHPAVGAFIDRTRAKRALIIAGACVLSGCGLAIVWMPILPVVLVADIIWLSSGASSGPPSPP
jgi:MFS-type transporter involved in bile tolerance (Atg22 family)